ANSLPADAGAGDGAGGIAAPADGLVVAERDIVGGQDGTHRIGNRAAQGYADEREVGAAPRVAAASPGLVVVERGIRDRGHAEVPQGPAVAEADVGDEVGAAGVVGAPDGLGVREATSPQGE